MDLLERMLGHDRWITAHLLSMCVDLSDDHLDREFDIGHRTLRATFDHMIFAVDLWTSLMCSEAVPPRASEQASIDDLRARHERASARFAANARDIVRSDRLDATFTDHHGHRQSFGSTILQVLYHNVQHRSEAMHILQRLGVEVRTDGFTQEWEHLTGRI